MKLTFTQKHPYLAVVLAGLLCTILTALGSAVPQIIGLTDDAQILVTSLFLLISVGIGLLIMKNTRFSFQDYGFQKSDREALKKIWWYLPLAAIEIIPILVIGFSRGVTVVHYLVLLLFTIAIGFNEEIYFRGLAFKAMSEKSRKMAIIWTSVIFGLLHAINAINGKNAVYVVLQVMFAFLVGFVLAEIMSITKSLWILILWHTMHDFISMSTGDELDTKALIVLAAQVGILLLYAFVLWKKSTTETAEKN